MSLKLSVVVNFLSRLDVSSGKAGAEPPPRFAVKKKPLQPYEETQLPPGGWAPVWRAGSKRCQPLGTTGFGRHHSFYQPFFLGYPVFLTQSRLFLFCPLPGWKCSRSTSDDSSSSTLFNWISTSMIGLNRWSERPGFVQELCPFQWVLTTTKTSKNISYSSTLIYYA